MKRGAQSSNARPILEQFLPIKDDKEMMVAEKDCKDNKMNWMTSVQLWKNDGDDTNICSGQNKVHRQVHPYITPIYNNLSSFFTSSRLTNYQDFIFFFYQVRCVGESG